MNLEPTTAEEQYSLGLAYYYGKGVLKDYAEAVKWIRKAAEQGHAHAQYSLGYAYDKGKGVLKDYAEAVKWFRRAAEQGNVGAQYTLGNAYLSGEGVGKDQVEGVQWLRKAAEKGNATAQYNLGTAYFASDSMVEFSNVQGVKWWRKAAEQGHVEAQLNLGDVYWYGQDAPTDKIEAVKWWRKAAEQGNSIAQQKLVDAFNGGHGVTRHLKMKQEAKEKAILDAKLEKNKQTEQNKHMKKAFKISALDVERAKITMHEFDSLALASKYIESMWFCSDMMDGIKSFSSADGDTIYNLHGFTLSDVGKFVVNSSSRIRELVFFAQLTEEDVEAFNEAKSESCTSDYCAFSEGFEAAIRYIRVPKYPGSRDTRNNL